MNEAGSLTRRRVLKAVGLASAVTASALPAWAQQRALRIGMVAPLTGVAAAFGTEYVEGARAYIAAWNARGGYKGVPVQLEVLDDESGAVGALNAFKRFAGEANTNLIWLASSTSAILAVKPVVDEYKVPVICGGISDLIGDPPAHWMFKVAPGTQDFQKVLMAWVKKRGFKRIAVVYPTDGYGQAEILSIKKLASENGAEVVAAETYQTSDTNFMTQLTKVRASKPDMVYIAGSSAPAILLFKQYKQLKLEYPLAVTQATVSRTFFESIGGPANAKGLFTATNVGTLGGRVQGTSGKIYAEMEKALMKKGTLMTTFGWDHGVLTEWAVESAGLDRQAIRDKLESARDVPAINGPFAYTPKNHIGQDVRGLVMAQHDGEKFVPAE